MREFSQINGAWKKPTWRPKNKGLEDDFPAQSGDLHVFSGCICFSVRSFWTNLWPRGKHRRCPVSGYVIQESRVLHSRWFDPSPQKRYSNTNDIVIKLIIYPQHPWEVAIFSRWQRFLAEQWRSYSLANRVVLPVPLCHASYWAPLCGKGLVLDLTAFLRLARSAAVDTMVVVQAVVFGEYSQHLPFNFDVEPSSYAFGPHVLEECPHIPGPFLGWKYFTLGSGAASGACCCCLSICSRRLRNKRPSLLVLLYGQKFLYDVCWAKIQKTSTNRSYSLIYK